MELLSSSGLSITVDENTAIINATLMSLGSASGFTIVGVLGTLIVAIINTCKPGNRLPTTLSWSLLGTEILDLFPEALLLAEAGVSGKFVWALVFSLFFFTGINTLIVTLDSCTSDSKKLNRALFMALNFSLGTLMYAIPSDIYNDFQQNWVETGSSLLDLFTLLFSTLIGGAIILTLLIRIHGSHATDPSELAAAQLLQNLKVFHEKFPYETWVTAWRVTDAYNKTKLRAGSEPVLHWPPEYYPAIPPKPYGASSEAIHEWIELSSLEPVNKPRPESVIAPSILQYTRQMLIWTALGILQAGVTALAAFIFYRLEVANETLRLVLEGVSGGCFLGTIAATIVPEISKQVVLSDMKHTSSLVIGSIFLISGLLVATLVDVIAGSR